MAQTVDCVGLDFLEHRAHLGWRRILGPAAGFQHVPTPCPVRPALECTADAEARLGEGRDVPRLQRRKREVEPPGDSRSTVLHHSVRGGCLCGDEGFGAIANWLLEARGDGAQGLTRGAGAEEVGLHPAEAKLALQ